MLCRRCDDVCDCFDCSDEEECETPHAAECNSDEVEVLNQVFTKVGVYNGQPLYVSADNQLKICYSYGDLIGGGYWAIQKADAAGGMVFNYFELKVSISRTFM